MKKILSILGAIGLTATTSAMVIACTNSEIPDFVEHGFSFDEIMKINNIDEINNIRKELHKVLKNNALEQTLDQVATLVKSMNGKDSLNQLPEGLTKEQFDKNFGLLLVSNTISVVQLALPEKTVDLLKGYKENIDNKLKKINFASKKHKVWITKLSKFVDEQLA